MRRVFVFPLERCRQACIITSSLSRQWFYTDKENDELICINTQQAQEFTYQYGIPYVIRKVSTPL